MNKQLLQDAKQYGVNSLLATSVRIGNKNLLSIPQFIFHMPNLEALNLSDNKLTTIPFDIDRLTKLEYLNIDKNKLVSIPPSIGKLKNLRKLSLVDNKLTTIPSSIGGLIHLDYMNLNKNELASIPSSIGKLENLRELSLVDNKLTAIPATIGNLKRLFFLNVNENELASLPESIGGMTRLTFLKLVNNKLTRLPESISKLNQLDTLELSGNPLTSVPESMRKKERNDGVRRISYDDKWYHQYDFVKLFGVRRAPRKNAMRINSTTNAFNNAIMESRLSNIPVNKRAFINNTSNVKNNGTLRRVYNINGLRGYMKGKMTGRLHGNEFTHNNIMLLKNVPFTVNKSAYLRNIKERLTNTSANNMPRTIKALKNTLPTNVNKNDVNRLAKNVVLNKVKNTSANNRNRLIKAYRSQGLLTNENAKKMEPK